MDVVASYNILEARNNLSKLLAQVESGAEEVVIMRRGSAIAKIVPVSEAAEPHRHTGAAILSSLLGDPVPPGVARTDEEIEADIREMYERRA